MAEEHTVVALQVRGPDETGLAFSKFHARGQALALCQRRVAAKPGAVYWRGEGAATFARGPRRACTPASLFSGVGGREFPLAVIEIRPGPPVGNSVVFYHALVEVVC